jgi:hypothetical protein
MNKTDLVTKPQIEELKTKLHGINCDAKIYETSHSRVPVDKVLDIHAFDLDRTLKNDAEFLNDDADHMHDSTVSSVGICIEGAFIQENFEDWLSELLNTQGEDIFRCKGILSMKDSDERFVFQGVHMMVNISGSSDRSSGLKKWGKGEPRMNKLCFIGRNLDRKALIEGVTSCIDNGKLPDPGEPPKTDLRFPVGTKVSVKEGTWKSGVVTKQWYREPHWPTGKFAPYEVTLDDGVIWVSADSDKLISNIRGIRRSEREPRKASVAATKKMKLHA